MVIRTLLVGLLLATATAGAAEGYASAAAVAVCGHSSAQPTLKQGATGRTPVIYTQKSFLDDCYASTTAFAGYPMQLADYRRSITAPPLPAGSSTWLMWQYTDAAIPAGLQAPSTADVFHGAQADLDRLANK